MKLEIAFFASGAPMRAIWEGSADELDRASVAFGWLRELARSAPALAAEHERQMRVEEGTGGEGGAWIGRADLIAAIQNAMRGWRESGYEVVTGCPHGNPTRGGCDKCCPPAESGVGGTGGTGVARGGPGGAVDTSQVLYEVLGRAGLSDQLLDLAGITGVTEGPLGDERARIRRAFLQLQTLNEDAIAGNYSFDVWKARAILRGVLARDG